MVAHHCATIALVLVSYLSGYNRVGLVVMVLFDASDVPLHAAKMCKYFGRAGAADALFAAFVVSFAGLRLVAYPYVCWQSHAMLARGETDSPGAVAASLVLLDCILVLNLMWGWTIAQLVRSVLAGNHVSDDRSDSD